MQLGVLPSFGNTGAWDVRIRPNFNGYSGNFGPAQRIQVAGTSASGELEYELVDAEKSMELVAQEFAVYPNPSNGELINIQASNLNSDMVAIRVIDAMGKIVFNQSYAVEGVLNASVAFEKSLSAGIYMVEISDNDVVKTERLIIQK
jgi:hypothetical protein